MRERGWIRCSVWMAPPDQANLDVVEADLGDVAGPSTAIREALREKADRIRNK
jgi:hypothetical protein